MLFTGLFASIARANRRIYVKKKRRWVIREAAMIEFAPRSRGKNMEGDANVLISKSAPKASGPPRRVPSPNLHGRPFPFLNRQPL